jgi:hypothetical protein
MQTLLFIGVRTRTLCEYTLYKNLLKAVNDGAMEMISKLCSSKGDIHSFSVIKIIWSSELAVAETNVLADFI